MMSYSIAPPPLRKLPTKVALKRIAEVCQVENRGPEKRRLQILNNIETFASRLEGRQLQGWEALNDEVYTEVLYGGAAGGGKSFLGSLWHIYRRIKYPGTMALIGRDELKRAKATTLKKVREVAKIVGLEEGTDWEWKEVASKIEWHITGCETLFMGLGWQPSDPDYQRFGGLELTDAFVDEAQTTSEKVIEIIGSRIRYRNTELGAPVKLLMTCNPGPHFLKHRFVKDENEQPVELPEYRHYIHALVDDNPDKQFVARYKNSLEKLAPYDRERLLYGNWNAEERTGGELYVSYDDQLHVRKNLLEEFYDAQLPIHLAFDFNTVPYNTCTVWVLHGKDLICIDEVCLPSPNNNTHRVCQALLTRFSGHEGGCFIYGDASGRANDTRVEQGYNDYTIIRNALSVWRPVERVPSANPPVHTRARFIDEIFRVNFGGITILIDDRCRNLKQDFANVKMDAEGGKLKKRITDPKTKVSYEPLGHTSDSAEYIITRLFASEFQRFNKGGTVDGISIISREQIHQNNPRRF